MILPWGLQSKLMPRIPDIRQLPSPIVDTIPKPNVEFIPVPPVVDSIDPPIVDVPSFEPPSYTPPQLNPEPEVVAPNAPSNTPQRPVEVPDNRDMPPPKAERPVISLPGGGEVPMPTNSEVALAGTTAIAATIAALLGKSLVGFLVKLLKPVVKKTILKTKEALGVRFTHLEEQQYFELEGSVAKQLKADAKAEKLRQLEEHSQRQHPHKR